MTEHTDLAEMPPGTPVRWNDRDAIVFRRTWEKMHEGQVRIRFTDGYKKWVPIDDLKVTR